MLRKRLWPSEIVPDTLKTENIKPSPAGSLRYLTLFDVLYLLVLPSMAAGTVCSAEQVILSLSIYRTVALRCRRNIQGGKKRHNAPPPPPPLDPLDPLDPARPLANVQIRRQHEHVRRGQRTGTGYHYQGETVTERWKSSINSAAIYQSTGGATRSVVAAAER